ncbi:TPM domain-containing protein [Streptomyces sp. NPDC095602]|uniref:TPM domain-containing protein n=1 Tax=Streptomyces sp. NPDC095602 TaxID=3155819 RepID=UPI0033194A03
MTRGAPRALVALLTGLLAAVCWLAGPAAPDGRAEEPGPLDRRGQITDRVDALGVRAPEVARALDRLYDEHRLQLFVVYVRDFSGRSPREWADATADRNGLGTDDVLLAVATRERRYAYTADAAGRLTQARLDEVARTAVEPALRAGDWAGAAIGAADGYAAALSGRAVPVPALTPGVPDPGGGGSPAVDLLVPVVLVAGALAVAGYAYTSRRRRARTRTTPHGGVPVPAPPELDERARRALVETDDAVRTSQEELGFAQAQFGEAAAKPFAEAVAYAQGELTAAFRLRQRLDDAEPEDEVTRRAMLEEIVARCADAGRRLDEESAAFDALRDLERTAPGALAAALAAHRELEGRLTTAEAALSAMRDRYTDAAAAPVATAPSEARARLAFAAANLSRAREALEGGADGAGGTDAGGAGTGAAGTGGAGSSGGTGTGGAGSGAEAGGAGSGAEAGGAGSGAEAGTGAAGSGGGAAGGGGERVSVALYLRAAEGALAQAARLVEAVDRRAVELAEAAGRLPGALAEAEADLAEARGVLEATPGGTAAGLRGRTARLESVVRDVRRAAEAGRYDPVDALRRTEEADAALDEALEREGGLRRARAFLDQALLAARSSVGAAEDYLATHRGAVASVARTRLAEARRHLAAAEAGAGPGAGGTGPGADADPRAALADAQRADALARQAQALAEQDVRLRGAPGGPGGLGGAVLGGILLGGLMGGGRSGGMPGGFAGGPASFGGGRTRGRLGGGGRF